MPEILDFLTDHALEILGFAIGILYLWWEYHADNRVWLASIVMPAISMWIYFSKGLYADFGINIYYFIIAIYGYVCWTSAGRKNTRSKGTEAGDDKEIHGRESSGEKKAELPVSRVPLKGMIIAGVASLALWGVLSWILITFTDSTVPYADALTTALSIVAYWMMARKWAEQWLVWFVVDAICVGLYIYKGLVFYPILYAIYTVIAILGYRKWLRMIPAT